MSEQRWVEWRDSDGHRYLCPADRVEEAEEANSDVERYWDEAVHLADDEEPLDENGNPLPAELPSFLVRIDGGQLDFADPRIGGVPLDEWLKR